MQRLGHLLAGSALGHEAQSTIKAAAIVAATSRTIQEELKLTPAEAQAVAFRRGEVMVRVAHGAIGGQIMIHQKKLLQATNEAVNKLYPGRAPAVERIVIHNS